MSIPWLFLLTACTDGMLGPEDLPGVEDDDTGGIVDARTRAFFEAEEAARAAAFAAGVTVVGRLRLPDGAGIAGATVTLGGATATTDADGRFELQSDGRRNDWLAARGPGVAPTMFSAWLAHPTEVTRVDLGDLAVRPDDGALRLLFAGDTSFGRRFLDPEERIDRYHMPPDDPAALIQVSAPGPGSVDVVSRVLPLFDAVDFPVLNLESVVTANPTTPHPTKSYCYFTLPDSLDAIEGLGVRYVSLGNNHLYDYLDPGVLDTHAALDARAIAHSGAGLTPEQAFVPWRATIGGLPLSFVSANSVSGTEHTIQYNATDAQGGAADLNDSARVTAAIAGERAAGRLPVAQLHTGVEYSVAPSDYTRTRLDLAADAGAALVVGHHPHVAQGFGVHAGVMQIHSLGNFTFDQDRHETMLGLIAMVDLDAERERGLAVYPVYIEDYRPRLAVGRTADAVLRRVAEHSDDTVSFTLEPGRLLVHRAGEANPARAERTVSVDVPIGDAGFGVLDLRDHLLPGESLVRVDAAPGALRLVGGRDLLVYGSFEDDDLDEDLGEAARYDLTSPFSDVCLAGARTGLQGLCLLRTADNLDATVVAFRNRVRVWGDALDLPNKDVTLFGYARAEGAGLVSVDVGFYASEGEATFGEVRAVDLDGGTFGWTPFWADLNIPPDERLGDPTANPRALRFFLRHAPPRAGEGTAMFDDLALVSWEAPVAVGATLRTPHARDFVRVHGAAGATIQVMVTARAGR